MRNKIFTLMLLVASFISYSQTDDFACGYDEFLSLDQSLINSLPDPFSYSTDPAVLYAMDPIVLNVFFWQVNMSDGQFGDDPNENDSITEDEVLKVIANLNMSFNTFNIFFKYKGLGEFNSPETVYLKEDEEEDYCYNILDDDGEPIEDANGFNTIDNLCQISQLFQWVTPDNGYELEGSINFYIPSHTIGFSGTATYVFPKIIVNRDAINSKRLVVHEMGHALFLRHPHYKFLDLEDPLDEDENYTECEHVTRDEGDIEIYNAKDNGDRVTDTAAAPNFSREHYYELLAQGETEQQAEDNYQKHKYIDSISCSYVGTGRDCLGVLYEIYDKDAQNVMSYTRGDCSESFTIGQAIKMHEVIEAWETVYLSKRAELADLFEPYKGEYYIAGPLPEGYQEPLFQPGFEYLFVECDGDYTSPAVTGEMFYYNSNNVLLSISKNETHYENIKHPNHSAIRIKHNYGDFLDKPEKCYNNFNKAPSGGSITKFNDDVFNTNVTITVQDSTSINNQNLIENLESGLYKIEKNYDDGSTQETVIYKENN